ncbi:MAG: glutaredoxin family protein [Chloroflexota bacterium]
MAITVWTKLGCGWCDEVIDLLRERGLPFEERVVTGDRERMAELIRKSGQTLAPVVEIEGQLLIDTDADEVERYLDRRASAV